MMELKKKEKWRAKRELIQTIIFSSLSLSLSPLVLIFFFFELTYHVYLCM